MISNLWQRFKASAYWKDIAWLSSGTAAAQGITLATLPVFSRLFTPADFAVQNLFTQVVGFAAIAATLRYEYFVQLPGEHRDGMLLVRLVALLGLAFALLITPIAWLFRGTFARWAGDPALAPWLVLAPLTGAAISLGAALQGWAQRRGLFRRSGEAEVAGKLGYAGAVLGGWLFLPGAAGLVLGTLATPLAKIAWLRRDPLREGRGRLGDVLRLAREYARLAGSLALSSGLYACTAAIPAVFIARVYGAATLGQYALAAMVVCLPSTLLGNAVGSVFYQRAAERWAQGNGFTDIWASTARKLLLIGLPLYGAAVLLLPWLFPFVFGEVWRPAGHYGALLAIGSFFNFISNPMEKACLVVRAWWYVSLWHAARVATTALTVWLALHYKWGMKGFIVALTIQQVVLYLIDYFAEWRFSRRKPTPGASIADKPERERGIS